MDDSLLFALVVVLLGAMLIYLIRNSTITRRYRDASETEGTWIDRKGGHYLRELGWLETVAIIVGAIVLLQAKYYL